MPRKHAERVAPFRFLFFSIFFVVADPFAVPRAFVSSPILILRGLWPRRARNARRERTGVREKGTGGWGRTRRKRIYTSFAPLPRDKVARV